MQLIDNLVMHLFAAIAPRITKALDEILNFLILYRVNNIG